MRLKLKSGDIYDTELHPTLQNLSKDGIKEIMKMIKNERMQTSNEI